MDIKNFAERGNIIHGRKTAGLGVLLFCTTLLAAQTRLASLTSEHLVTPLGIDVPHPRLSWKLSSGVTGAKQLAYQLTVGTDSVAVSRMQGLHWLIARNSGEQQVVYAGKDLQPHTKYYWSVTVRDNGGKKTSATSYFETGKMSSRDWKGSWISDTRDVDRKPAALFRKSFPLQKPVKSARAYIAAAGLYELYVNGRRIGEQYLDPTYTRYDRRNLSVTHDITAALTAGKNAIGVMLGNGWYNHQSTAVWDFHRAPWRARPSFCMDVRIVYTDGSVEVIKTGSDWKTTLGPVVFNSIYTGEHYDARRELPGWHTASFVDTAWRTPIYVSAPSSNIVAQALPPIQASTEIPAQRMQAFSDTVYVFDIGRNISGISRVTLRGEKGTVVRLKHGERLYANGRVDQSNIDVHYRPTDDSDPFATDIFILNGGGEESFQPRFNYKGFQFVELTASKPVTVTKESLTALFLHSGVKPAGAIASSDTVINKIWSATNNAYLSNLFGYPTDCPQREKNGWTGDAAIAIETGLYNFDAITVYEKWMADHRDEQQPNGILPSIIPTSGWGYEWGNGPDWTSTIAIIPWNLYLFYGDSRALAENYTNIKRYVDHINERFPAGLCNWGLGDWVPVKTTSSVELTSTCYYYADVMILAKAARLLGKKEDEKIYTALAGKIRKAFNDKFLNPVTKVYHQGTQTELAVPLYWKLLPDSLVAAVAANLAARVEKDSSRLDVGLLGTKAILNALSENGYADLAFKLASSRSYPSWGWWIVNGATTLYENWNIGAANDISLNHIMFGEIGAWFYKALGGIRPTEGGPGFKNIRVQPHFVKGLDQFSCYHDGPYGRITSAWKRTGTKIQYSLTVPPNSSATLLLQGKTKELPAGTFTFTVDSE